MSWLFSRALVEAYSGASSSGGEPYAPLNLMPSPQPFLHSDKTTDFSPPSQFGLTLQPLTADRGEELLTWYLAGFLARTSAQQEREPVLRASDPAYGWKWPASFAKYDPASRSWKTRQSSLLGGLVEFSEIWPRWGWMRDGESLPLPTPALRISESESGLWPTPTRRDYRSEECSQEYADKRNAESRGKTLPWAVRWPTPTVKGNYNRKGLSAKSGDGLATAVSRWPTPHGFSKDGRSNGPSGNELGRAVNQWRTPDAYSKRGGHQSPEKRKEGGHSVNLQDQVGGSLNPTWVEWLMGWPIGWTALKQLETDKYQQWRHLHGAC